MNKHQKIINDPVHGFMPIYNELILAVINHPIFQRLRRIKQLGLSDLVYPGALHTRFHHALGAMHLMRLALDTLRNKGHEITEAEYEGALLAILLHDIGHSPFSHALEHSILDDIAHEKVSLLLMQYLNTIFDKKLDIAIQIFSNQYPKKFLHQLVSSQLDMDRLDYLQRDSFFTGVVEGNVGGDRIISMLEVRNDEIVWEEKAIYSIESFLNARRLMYWQVYLHKTTVATEQMLIQAIRRAKFLVQSGEKLLTMPSLNYFLEQKVGIKDFEIAIANPQEKHFVLNNFIALDDYDVLGSIKLWANSTDKVLSRISNMLLQRNLFKTSLENEKHLTSSIQAHIEAVQKNWKMTAEEANFLVVHGVLTNAAYQAGSQKIKLLRKNGERVLCSMHATVH
ncbi:MAG: HD domain-containing protein, partial [Thermoflexibacteraceae bacterium]